MTLGQRFVNLLLALATLMVSQVPVTGLVLVAMFTQEQGLPGPVLGAYVAVQLVVLGLLLWLASKQGLLSLGRSWLSQTTWLYALLGFVALLAVSLLGNYFLQMLGLETTANQEYISAILEQLPVMATFMAAVLNAGISEEIVCRGFMIRAFEGRFSWLGYVVSSLVFAALHGPTDWPSWFIYTAMGGVLAFLRYRTKSLEASILAHGLNNFVATIMFYF